MVQQIILRWFTLQREREEMIQKPILLNQCEKLIFNLICEKSQIYLVL